MTDQELLRDYTASRSEAAFAELVRRHVDFVYSAALRMVHDAHTADDVTQGVFMALAENAGKLTDRPILAGWLYRTTQFLASKAVRSEVRRRAREQEAAAMIELSSAEPDAIWQQIAPTLDTALDEMDETDRDVLFLRYFQHKSAREISETLGINEEAAKKRVSRAVERLRELFAKRGITVGAAGIIVAISANAVQAAPIGLAAVITTSVSLAGTGFVATTTAAATKAIAMTTMQKGLVTGAITICLGTAIYEAHQASSLRAQIESLQIQIPAGGQSGQHNSLDPAAEVAKHVSALQVENERLKSNNADLLRLRSEVARLRREGNELAQLKDASKVDSAPYSDRIDDRINELTKKVQQGDVLSAKELMNMGAVTNVAVGLTNSSDAMRYSALQFLSTKPGAVEFALPMVVQRLNDSEPPVRRSALQLLGLFPHRRRELEPWIKFALNDSNQTVRQVATEILQSWSSPQ